MTDKSRLIKGGEAFGYPVSALRTEARKGRLALIRIAGKDWVSEAAIREMERKCRNTAREQGSISETKRAMASPTSSSTVPGKNALAAALISCNRLKKPLRTTSQRTTGHEMPSHAEVFSLCNLALAALKPKLTAQALDDAVEQHFPQDNEP